LSVGFLPAPAVATPNGGYGRSTHDER